MSNEKKRRDNMNDCVDDFAKLIPDVNDALKLNKGALMRKAVDYMEALIEHNQELEDQLQTAVSQWTQADARNAQLSQQLQELTKRMGHLQMQHNLLTARLTNGKSPHSSAAPVTEHMMDFDLDPGLPPQSPQQVDTSPLQFLSGEAISDDPEDLESFIQDGMRKHIKDSRRKELGAGPLTVSSQVSTPLFSFYP